MLHDGYMAVANLAVGYTAIGLLGPVIRSIFNHSVDANFIFLSFFISLYF